MDKLQALCVKLKTGEYDGADIMGARLAIESFQKENMRLREALEDCTEAVKFTGSQVAVTLIAQQALKESK